MMPMRDLAGAGRTPQDYPRDDRRPSAPDKGSSRYRMAIHTSLPSSATAKKFDNHGDSTKIFHRSDLASPDHFVRRSIGTCETDHQQNPRLAIAVRKHHRRTCWWQVVTALRLRSTLALSYLECQIPPMQFRGQWA